MAGSQPSVLEALRRELEFLEGGGYRIPSVDGWRPALMFEDSPTCINFLHSHARRRPCSECVLHDFVPEEYREAEVPCQYVVLNEETGTTVDGLYRWGTQEELEHEVRGWLLRRIAELEQHETRRAG